MLLKYYNDLAMSAQNMTYEIFAKYYQKLQMHEQCFFQINYTEKIKKIRLFSCKNNGHVFLS